MIGFSSAICPGLDGSALLEQAKTLGYDAVEWRGRLDAHGQPSPCTEQDAAALLAASKATGVAVVCLASGSRAGNADRHTRRQDEDRIRSAIDAAGQMGCPFVTVGTAAVPACHDRDPVIARIVSHLRSLAPYAAERNVSLLVENEGSFATSRDVWYIVDATGHAAVRCCWNVLNALAAGDTHTLAVPRIARLASVVHLADAKPLAGSGAKLAPLGQGDAQLDRFLLLMRGVAMRPHLVVDVPAGRTVADPQEFLGAAKTWIDAQLKRIDETPELTAYKGDKNAPRFTAAPGRATANA